MPTATATALAQRPRVPYENWRPPVIGVSLLVPVGADCITVVDLRGMLMLPVGGVYDGQTPEEAVHRVLIDPSGRLRLVRRVAVDWVQTRRRKVITYVTVAAPMTRGAVRSLVYRDPRATVRVMPTLQVLDQWPTGRTRLLVSLQAMATGNTACIDGGIVQAQERPALGCRSDAVEVRSATAVQQVRRLGARSDH